MEQISAFAAYNANKLKKTKKTQNKNQKKANKSQSSIENSKNKNKTVEDAAKQALIQNILKQQFKNKNKSKKNKTNGSVNHDFETPQFKKRKVSTSTPNEENFVVSKKKKQKSKIFEEPAIPEPIEIEENKDYSKTFEENGLQNIISDVSSSSSSDEEEKIVRPSPKSKKNQNKTTLKQKDGKNVSNLNSKPTCDIMVIDNPEQIVESDTESVSDLVTPKTNSIMDGEKLFDWLINPIEIKSFFEDFWEKAPCLVRRDKDSDYYSTLLSFEMIDKMLLDNHVEFTKNIDITKYENGVRETLNPEGRALPATIWEKYAEGCSIRILNPQTFLPNIFALNTTLQEYFHCMVGANVYLTPPNSQGFAPHYDDIEAFVLQIEGKKEWKLYNPRSKNEQLPRFSSRNFQQNEIGEPILCETLEPGNILYFPRGTIHQANTVPGCHSLHITLSVYQKQSYADLCEKLFPLLLKTAIENDVEMRRGLPLHIWNNMGIVHTEERNFEREEVIKHVRECIRRAVSWIAIDDAVDQLAKKFQHEALPPLIQPNEQCRTVFGCKNYLDKNGEVMSSFEMTIENRIRLLRAHILRLVEEEGVFRIYFYIDNSKEYKEYEPNFIEIEAENAPAIEVLVKCYPDYVYVKDLPLDDDDMKLNLSQALFDRGLIMLSDNIK